MGPTVTIEKAANILQVTTKTIRNYIDRGFLESDKWNGMIQIQLHEVLEIAKKKNVKLDSDLETAEGIQDIQQQVKQIEQAKRLAKAEVFENLLNEKKQENQQLLDRVNQLEASSAAGWSEVRSLEKKLDKAECDLEMQNKALQNAREEHNWLRREQERIAGELVDHKSTIKNLRQKISDLESQLHIQSLFQNE